MELEGWTSTAIEGVGQLSDFVLGPGPNELSGLDEENGRLVLIDAKAGVVKSSVSDVGGHPVVLQVP